MKREASSTETAKKKQTALEALRSLKKDVKELNWYPPLKGEHDALISKPEVLELIQDWIEYALDPE